MTYQEKLKDPRWQKKRLEILQRDEFACIFCGNDKTTLHVHHLYYSSDPWDVPNDDLITLCESCHETEHTQRKQSEDQLLQVLKSKRLTSAEVACLANDLAKLDKITIVFNIQTLINGKNKDDKA